MNNSQCGPWKAVRVISNHNLKQCPPPHCLLAACCKESGQAGWYSHRVLSWAGAPQWMCGGHFSWQTGQVCVQRHSLLPCLPRGPCCTCKHCRVMGSSHMLRASPGQLGCVYASLSGLCVCVYMCAFLCVCLWIRGCSKGTLESEYDDYFDVPCILICAWECVCVCLVLGHVEASGSRQPRLQWNSLQMCLCVLAPLYDSANAPAFKSLNFHVCVILYFLHIVMCICLKLQCMVSVFLQEWLSDMGVYVCACMHI